MSGMEQGRGAGSWNPWAPRTGPDGGAAQLRSRPAAPPVTPSHTRPRTGQPGVHTGPGAGQTPASGHTPRFETGPVPPPHAPVADDRRPPGAAATPPTAWPAPRYEPDVGG